MPASKLHSSHVLCIVNTKVKRLTFAVLHWDSKTSVSRNA